MRAWIRRASQETCRSGPSCCKARAYFQRKELLGKKQVELDASKGTLKEKLNLHDECVARIKEIQGDLKVSCRDKGDTRGFKGKL